jgi:hypothetical protein
MLFVSLPPYSSEQRQQGVQGNTSFIFHLVGSILLCKSGMTLCAKTPSAFCRTFPQRGPFSLFGWLVADGWCWFVLREEYCWLVAGGWFVLREKYCWLVADKPSEQAVC